LESKERFRKRVLFGEGSYTANYSYDAAGHLTSASDGNSTYAMTYNSNGLVTQIDNNGTPTGPRVVINVGYDNLSRMTSQSATVSSTADFLNNYTYDAASRLTKITQTQQTGGHSVADKRIDLTYTAANLLSTVDRYADLTGTNLVATSTWGYDAKGQATSLSEVKGGTTLESYTWTYDHIGRLTADTIGAANDTYTYDANSQVTAATHSGGSNQSFSYDANGNRTNTGYSTTTDNEMTSDGTYNYHYDNQGNIDKKTTISTGTYITYTWDYRNRLTDAKTYNSSNVLTLAVKYAYDVFDRLIEKQVDPTGGGTYTSKQRYAYDANNNIVLVYNGSGSLTDRMLNGESLNQHLADENGSGTVSWYLTDREGTVNDVIRYASGTTTVVDHLTYGVFGNISSQTNSGNQPLFAYTSQLWDPSTVLYYDHARWYDARTGRFLSRDPLSFHAGDTDLYRYVHNGPTNFTDPTGLQEEKPKTLQDFLPKDYPYSGGAPTAEMWQDPEFQAAYTQWIASLVPAGPSDGPQPAAQEGHWYYLTHPSAMDTDLQLWYWGAAGVVVGAGAGAAVIVAAPVAIGAGTTALTSAGMSSAAAATTSTVVVNTALIGQGAVGIHDITYSTVYAAETGDWNTVLFNGGAITGGILAGAARPSPTGATSPKVGKPAATPAPASPSQGGGCFPANTLIASEFGKRPIANVEIGDRVWSFNMLSENWELALVTKRSCIEYQGRIVQLQVAGEILESTEDHPFWVVSGRNLEDRPKPKHAAPREVPSQMPGRWVDATCIQECDVLQLMSGFRAVVVATQFRMTNETVYNLNVQEHHCYAIGEQSVLVHNNVPCGQPNPTPAPGVVVTERPLYAGGNSPNGPKGPVGARPAPKLKDFEGLQDPSHTVGAEAPPNPQGMSTFDSIANLKKGLNPTDPSKAQQVWQLPKGTPLPQGLAVIADNVPQGHNTLFPSLATTFNAFLTQIQSLPWDYLGKM
jgi:RHS repeat-associated protein